MKQFLLVAFTFALLTVTANAHGGSEHGTRIVTANSNTSIPVKTVNGITAVVALSPATDVLRGTAAMSPNDIKSGNRVVVHAATKHAGLTAAEVKEK